MQIGSSVTRRGLSVAADQGRLLCRRIVPFKSDIRQSWCNADPEAEVQAIKFLDAQSPRTGQGYRVLMSAGGGDCALATLAMPQVTRVTTVSPYAAQHHLTALKLRLALSDLPREEVVAVLGMEEAADPLDADGAARRRALMERHVLPGLARVNPAAAAFWSERMDQEVAFGIGKSGREQRWRAERVVGLHELEMDAAALLSDKPLQAAKAFRSTDVVEEGLVRAIPASTVAAHMGWDHDLDFLQGRAWSDAAADLRDLHRARAAREADAYFNKLKDPAARSAGRALLYAHLALTNSFPHGAAAADAREPEDALPLWLSDDWRDELRERFRADVDIIERGDCVTGGSGLLRLAGDGSGLLAWQRSAAAPSAVAAASLQAEAEGSGAAARDAPGFDLVSMGEALDLLGSARSASAELSVCCRALTSGGIVLGRRSQGRLNTIMAQHLILQVELDRAVADAEHTPWYGASQQHVLAGVEDSF